ncbi:MAG TPA: hypothetical protein PLG09_07425 [Syntrophomonadaceae bacterium]|jgi:hypothetical protein|nr:hypothetical protein [Syntrophomonadaceae bacterium]HPU49717.1 hypothetical protein [Syntrophomonadaceae bacterium]
MLKIIDHKEYRQHLLQKCFQLFFPKSLPDVTMRPLAMELLFPETVPFNKLACYFQEIFVSCVEARHEGGDSSQ